jgi:hypothetical protein
MANETNLHGPAYGFLMLMKVTLCIRSKIEAAQSVALTASALSKACLYALALWKKFTLLGVSRIRAEYKLAADLHASGSSWSKELVAHRQSTGGSQGCGDSLGRRKLPQAERAGTRLLFRDSPRPSRFPDPASPRPYSHCVGRPAFIDSSDLEIIVK